MLSIYEYWNKFLKETKRDPNEKASGEINFEAKGFLADQLSVLLMSGVKTAFFSSLPSFLIDNLPLPIAGELYIVLDRAENPICVIEITNVEILPFSQVTWEMAKKEGEDQNLDLWKEKEIEYLQTEGDILGFDFSQDLKLVFQEFKVIYK